MTAGLTVSRLRAIAAVAGAIAAGAGAGVGAGHLNPAAPGSAASDVALTRRVADLEAWQEKHEREAEKLATNRDDLDRLRSELAELRRRVDREVDRERSRSGSGGMLLDPWL